MSEEARRLLNSGLVSKFVREKNGSWNHQDWRGFLGSVRNAGYRALPDNEVGLLLEQEKARYWAAKAQAPAPPPKAAAAPPAPAPKRKKGR